MIKKNKNNVKRFLILVFKKNKITLIITFIGMIIISILELLTPQITRIILDDVIKGGKIKLLIKLIFLYVLLIILSSILQVTLDFVYSKIKNKISINLKIKILKHIGKQSGSYYTDIKTGNLMSIFQGDIHNIQVLGVDLIFSIIVDAFTALAALFLLARMQIDLLFIVLVIQFLLVFFQTKVTRIILLMMKKIGQGRGNIMNVVHEYMSNILYVVMSKSNLMFFSNYIKKERKLTKKSIKLDMTISGNMALSKAFIGIITISVYGYGALKIIKGQMTFGKLVAFQQYVGMLIGPCMDIIRSSNQIQQATVSLNRIYNILDEPITIKQNNRGKKFLDNCLGEIDFDKVSFSYDKSNKIIDNINLKFENGKITALVGKSGCGKSTIVKLLFRLWDVDDGHIKIDNNPLEEYNLKSVRKKMTIVTQDILIFDDTILNNITLKNRNIRKSDVKNICKKVGIYDFVINLPNKFDTIVGESGVKLSGGQKQRVAIARALLDDSKIIIFDEATSALDNVSQRDILKNIACFLVHKTTVVIAHRLSTIKDADKIYVIDKGRVIEEGNHLELIKNGGMYSKLCIEENLN